MIKEKELQVTWVSKTKDWYISKGYTFTKYYDRFMVKIEDVTEGSHELVTVICDGCGKSLGENQTYGKVVGKRKARNSNLDFCKQCIGKQQRNDITVVRNTFIERGYIPKFNDEDYKNAHSQLAYVCPKHSNEVQYATYSNIKKFGCYYCGRESTESKNRYDENFVLEQFELKELKVLDGERYINMDTPIKYICPIHPDKIQEITFYSLYFENHGCWECSYDKHHRGENSNFWKGGIEPISHKIRNSSDYKSWREGVFEKDNYTCQCCGDNKGGNLQSHHIENFSDNEDLRFDVNNGITLCENCHNPSIKGSFHHIYGTHNNNKEQLLEYINNFKNRQKAV